MIRRDLCDSRPVEGAVLDAVGNFNQEPTSLTGFEWLKHHWSHNPDMEIMEHFSQSNNADLCPAGHLENIEMVTIILFLCRFASVLTFYLTSLSIVILFFKPGVNYVTSQIAPPTHTQKN